MQLSGFHHLTAITADAPGNHAFYTRSLGLRLVKKTVNQDDVSAYHLFYADGDATPGSDITFFDWPVARERRGTRSIVRTGFRVANEDTLKWWSRHFTELAIAHGPIESRDGRPTVDFEDPEGQRLSLVVDPSGSAPRVWSRSPVPAEHQIIGLGPITISVPEFAATEAVLTKVMNMARVREYRAPWSAAATASTGNGSKSTSATVHVFQMHRSTSARAGVGAAAELHVAVESELAPARQGAGGVHHVAFRTPTFAEYDGWAKRLVELGIPSSGPVDRFYFRSLYFREPNGILFEIATDEPGFAADEPKESLGERLALPPFLESRRSAIEAGLKPLRTNER